MLKTNSSQGFTLIEVLIAVIVLAMGLLGFAALQALTLKDSKSAYHRSLATQLAYDIADRMRANKGAGNLYLSATMSPSSAASQGSCNSSAGCTPTAMAENDLYEWNLALAELPRGSGVESGDISVAAGVYTVDIKWDDNKTGVTANYLHFVTSFSL